MEGANKAYQEFSTKEFEDNIALKYAALRHYQYNDGKKIEVLVSYEPKLSYISEWWKQLYGESEGKDKKVYSLQV